MKIKIQIVIENKAQPVVENIACLERENLSEDTLGLTLKETKNIIANVQKSLVSHQITDYISQQRPCLCCGKLRNIHGYHKLTYRTLFGKLHLESQGKRIKNSIMTGF